MSKMFRRFFTRVRDVKKGFRNRGNILQTTCRNRAVVGAGSCGRFRGIE